MGLVPWFFSGSNPCFKTNIPYHLGWQKAAQSVSLPRNLEMQCLSKIRDFGAYVSYRNKDF